MNSTGSRSIVATLSFGVAVLAVLAVVIGVLGPRSGLLPPLTGFSLFGLGTFLLPVLGLLLAVVGLIRTRGKARYGRERALTALVVCGGFLVLFLVLAGGSGGVPPIHDITTSPDRVPLYEAALEDGSNVGRDLTYPHGGPQVTALQREGYPDLAPVKLTVGPDEAFQRGLSAAGEMGLEMLTEDAARHRFEATGTSAIFRFVDDFVVEIEEAGSGSVVHVRSTSRVGQSDLGANAERIRDFASRIAN